MRSIYEKEAGHYDWQHLVFGDPLGWVRATSMKHGILVGTKDGRISLLDSISGKLEWKNSVSTAPIISVVDSQAGVVIVVSADATVSGFDIRHGALLWSGNYGDVQSVSTCDARGVVQLQPIGKHVHVRDGSPSEVSTSCGSPARFSSAPLIVEGVSVSVNPNLQIVAERDGKRVWTREECISFSDDVVVVRINPNAKVGKHDLSWLIGGYKAAVILSKRFHRLVVVDVVSSKVIGSLDVDPSVSSLKTSGDRVHLMSAADITLSTLDVTTMTIYPGAEKTKPDRFYRVDDESGDIEGQLGDSIAWNIKLGSPVLAVIEQSHKEYGNVPVLVKGDASVVFKYMNPNLVTVITKLNEGITVWAFDSVTGFIVVQILIEGASYDPKTFHFVSCDNWIVGHYYSTNFERFEVIAIDLYDKREDKGFYAAAMGHAANSNAASAYELTQDVLIVHQQYVFPLGAISSIAVTATEKGVTPRQIIFATQTGILAVRKDTWLNPRRSGPGISIPERLAVVGDEALPPYTPILPIIATDFVSHARVLQYPITKMVSVPTHLESTSILLAMGPGDLFVAPIYIGNAPYDVLSPFFNYWLLYVSLAAVVTAVAVTAIMAKRKDLYNKWK